MVEDIQRVHEIVKPRKWMTRESYERRGEYSINQITREFGNWTEALKAADLMNPEKHRSKEHILKDIKELNENLSRRVTKSQYKRKGNHTPQTVVKKFGSWEDALNEAGVE